MQEQKFINGMRIFKPHPNAPSFIKGQLLINCQEFVEFMKANHINGEMRIDVKMSKENNLYLTLNEYYKEERAEKPNHQFGQGKTYQEVYKPNKAVDSFVGESSEDIQVEDIPF